MITLLANALREQGSGTIIVFSSIAGQRVRRANYVYGSTKAGPDGFCVGAVGTPCTAAEFARCWCAPVS